MNNQIIKQLFFEREYIWASPYSILFAIILLVIGSLISLYITLKINQNLKHLKSIRGIILPIYKICIYLTIRYILSLIDFIIWYQTKGNYSLNGFYESIIWLLILYEFSKIISNQDLIQVSRNHINRFNFLIDIIFILIIISLIPMIIFNFVITDSYLETFGFIPSLIISLIIIYILIIEYNYVGSKIIKIRLEYLIKFWKYSLIYMFSFIIGYGLIYYLYPDGKINGIYFSIVAIFLNLSPIYISFALYNALFIPDNKRLKYGISNPKSF